MAAIVDTQIGIGKGFQTQGCHAVWSNIQAEAVKGF